MPASSPSGGQENLPSSLREELAAASSSSLTHRASAAALLASALAAPNEGAQSSGHVGPDGHPQGQGVDNPGTAVVSGAEGPTLAHQMQAMLFFMKAVQDRGPAAQLDGGQALDQGEGVALPPQSGAISRLQGVCDSSSRKSDGRYVGLLPGLPAEADQVSLFYLK